MSIADKYGFCVSCHRNLITERVVDGKVITMFTPDHSETEFMLNDGSRMRVCICTLCKAKFTLSDPDIQKQIMESVKAGWQLEVDTLVADPNAKAWDAERGKKHMEIYNQKEIEIHSEGLAKHQIEENQKRLSQIVKEK